MGISIETAVVALANIGSVAFLVKRVVDRVDKHQEVLPAAIETLRIISEGQKELIDSRNEHASRLMAIETTHKNKGCSNGPER